MKNVFQTLNIKKISTSPLTSTCLCAHVHARTHTKHLLQILFLPSSNAFSLFPFFEIFFSHIVYLCHLKSQDAHGECTFMLAFSKQFMEKRFFKKNKFIIWTQTTFEIHAHSSCPESSGKCIFMKKVCMNLEIKAFAQ